MHQLSLTNYWTDFGAKFRAPEARWGSLARAAHTRPECFIFAIKSFAAMAWSALPHACARRSAEINARPGIDSLQSAHQRHTTERLSGRRVIDVAADGTVWFVARCTVEIAILGC